MKKLMFKRQFFHQFHCLCSKQKIFQNFILIKIMKILQNIIKYICRTEDIKPYFYIAKVWNYNTEFSKFFAEYFYGTNITMRMVPIFSQPFQFSQFFCIIYGIIGQYQENVRNWWKFRNNFLYFFCKSLQNKSLNIPCFISILLLIGIEIFS